MLNSAPGHESKGMRLTLSSVTYRRSSRLSFPSSSLLIFSSWPVNCFELVYVSLYVQHYGDEISEGKGTHYPNPNHNNDNGIQLMGFSEISLSLTFILPITAANS